MAKAPHLPGDSNQRTGAQAAKVGKGSPSKGMLKSGGKTTRANMPHHKSSK